MDDANMKTRVRNVLREHLGIQNIEDDKVFYSPSADTGIVPHYSSDELDSLDMVEFAMAIEEEFDVVISDEVSKTMVSVNATIDAIKGASDMPRPLTNLIG